ncbi:MAG: SagB/ThcOx family dehydrogenase [Deltaproteobacteria bacterium]
MDSRNVGGPAEAASRYHTLTKHSPASVGRDRHFLDWEIKPLPLKVYTDDLETVALPQPLEDLTAGGPHQTDLAGLARILGLAAGIIRKRTYAGGRSVYFRAAACTGALYHIDLYLVCGQLDGLNAGLYHFAPHDFSLRKLRSGDLRGFVAEATGREEAVSRAPVQLISTSTLWRNSWKYQSRAYRHCYWDDGTILANLLAVAAADEIPARVVMGFVDDQISRLLDLNTDKEVAISIVALGVSDQVPDTASTSLEALNLATEPLSSREVDYPAITEAHQASRLASAAEVAHWRKATVDFERGGRDSTPAAYQTPTTIPLDPATVPPAGAIDQVILHRGSSRRFAQKAIGFDQLSSLLASATEPVALDIAGAAGRPLSDVYVIANAVDGLQPGAYFFDRKRRDLELLRAGTFRNEAGFLGLNQALPADASVNVYLMCDLERILAAYGARGYRAAQLEAAITGGRLYLASYALGLGATGLTFFDDEVTDFFSPHAQGKAVMFLVATGHGRKIKSGAL